MSGFNVCLVQPPDYPHSYVFYELGELLRYSLLELGHESSLVFNDIDPARRNIVIGCHLLEPSKADLLPESTIILNTEQIYSEDRFEWNRTIFEFTRRFEVWDYSPRNIAEFSKMGITNIKLLEIGYQAELNRIGKCPQRDIDVLFYGSHTQRRIKIFEGLHDAGLKIVTLFGVYGQERDDHIARSKLVLNMHNHASEIFEIVRVSYLLNNAVAVVGEVNSSTQIPEFYAEAIAGVPYESLVEECVRLAGDDAAREKLEHNALEMLAQHPQRDFTRAVLQP